jgi:prefoldin subunit 5
MNKDLSSYIESRLNEAAELLRKQQEAIVWLRKELNTAITQNDHDMIMTGDEIRHARKVLEATKEFV